MEKIKMSLIINVLESYEITKRQILYYSNNYNELENWELIIVDDGSDPSIVSFLEKDKNFKSFKISHFEGLEVHEYSSPINFVIINTCNKKPWSNSSARNMAARYSKGKYILFNDIDHIYTKKATEEALSFEGSKMHHRRYHGILTENGEIVEDRNELVKYFKSNSVMDKKMDKNLGTPCNIFVIKKEIFEAINGYDEKFDGRHGGEDTNFHDRFSQFIHKNNIDRGFRGEEKIFVYPDPAGFNKHMFHTSGRKDK